jgi:DNA-binding PadR family transcriptional regulator
MILLDLIAISQVICCMKQTEGVPRGLLRFIVLRFLAERPISGSEIAGKIAHETGGKWKPSPGSIYPLLAGLQEKGFTQESFAFENGMKHYSLTNSGKEFFEAQVLLRKKFMEKMECLVPMFIEGFYFIKNEENSLGAKESAKRVLKTFIELNSKKEFMTKENVAEIARILDNSNTQLRRIIEEINRENQARISE